jgi:HAD superfamily hydrolase (TIGR01509 family)
MLTSLIFDFDGLILDTETPDFLAWGDIYRAHGQELTIQTWGQIIGGSHASDFEPEFHLQKLIGHDLDCASIRAEADRRSLEAIHRNPILPGVIELISSAKSIGLRLAIASSSPHSWVDAHLKRLGLFEHFDPIVCREDVQRTKPAPDLFLLALKKLNAGAAEAIVFEDSPNGAAAARAASIFCVVVKNPCTAQLPFSAGDHFAESLEHVDLTALL